MYWGYFYDYYYIVLVVPMIVLSVIAQVKVKSAYSKYSKTANSRGLTGASAAYAVLNHYGINNVAVEQVAGNLTDHYDPRTNVIRLSQGVYNSTSVAAVGIACHEAGHAAQHAEGYAPIKIRNTILPVCNIGSSLGISLALIGIFMSFEPLIVIGICLYAAVTVFQLVTLPVEFNASRRAVEVIEGSGLLSEDEQSGAKKVLTAAAMTYVAALAVSAANLLRLILRYGNRRR
ncbi:MAG: zinc metallopeptidase [Clostridiales bacterium]|jgi:Zn-dependent membrane protease YugP|nr:zinc metallopeptidase [Clostridiales bacterium]